MESLCLNVSREGLQRRLSVCIPALHDLASSITSVSKIRGKTSHRTHVRLEDSHERQLYDFEIRALIDRHCHGSSAEHACLASAGKSGTNQSMPRSLQVSARDPPGVPKVLLPLNIFMLRQLITPLHYCWPMRIVSVRHFPRLSSSSYSWHICPKRIISLARLTDHRRASCICEDYYGIVLARTRFSLWSLAVPETEGLTHLLSPIPPCSNHDLPVGTLSSLFW
jgi:hypothetical protein